MHLTLSNNQTRTHTGTRNNGEHKQEWKLEMANNQRRKCKLGACPDCTVNKNYLTIHKLGKRVASAHKFTFSPATVER